jgi:dihydrolipoamide dehydrogenase
VPSGFDIAVVGGGPGGYVAAIRAAQLGAKTAIVERDRLGGTCLVRGCIPTKALLQSSELYHVLQRGKEFGVLAENVRFDLAAAQKRKTQVVDQLVKGVEGLLKAGGVEIVNGHGRLRKGNVIEVDGHKLEAKNIVIATGSAISRIPLKGVEHTIDSDQILELKEVPERMAVIGGGVVGMEWGALFAALGTKVTVLEMLPTILPMVEADLLRLYVKHFEGLGGVIHTEAKVEEVVKSNDGLSVRYSKGGDSDQVDADVVLLAVGRTPYTDDLGLDDIGVELDKKRVKVDDHLRTSADGVYAIGDVIGGIMLAHVASYEGVCAIENICGKDRVPDYKAAPNCIYTDPEIAHVGLSEKDARERGIEVNVGRFPFNASGRAMTLGQTEGAIKVVTGAKDGKILGVHMVGPRVTDVIAEAVLAVQNEITVEELDLTMHAHPTMAEALMEATLATENRAIHIQNKKGSQASSTPGGEAPKNSKESEVKEEVARPVEAKNDQRPQAEASAVAVRTDAASLELKKDNKDALLKLYHEMYLIRRFEERAQVEYTKAKIGGYCHLNLGEEATVVGGIAPLKSGDYIFTSYREHGHAIARGVDPKAVMAELFGRESGVAHGRGGSMHIFDYSHRFMGGYGIVGGHLPLATGAAFSIKYQKQKDIVFCMFGDGVVNIGAFHESLNFAKVQKLPVLWFLINNQYGMGTAVDRASAVSDLYERACAYDMEAIRIDGNDVLEVARKTGEFVEKVRKDSEPRLIEALCYRFKGHSVVDPDKYRSDEEKQKWLKSDPILHFEHELKEAKVADDGELKKIQQRVDDEVDEIVKFADESPNPSVDELYRYVYGGEFEMAGRK